MSLLAPHAAPAPDLTADEAQVLTAKIKAHVCQAWVLINEAHDRKAHRALGYATFEDYVRDEFDMGRSRAYQLLDQAHVIAELSEAAGMSTMVDTEPVSPMGDTETRTTVPPISERETRDLKPRLAEVADDVRERVANGTPPADAIRQAVDHARADRQAIRDLNALAPDDYDRDADIARMERIQPVFRTARTLTALGDPEALIADLRPYNAHHLPDVEAAADWLARFVAAWKDQP